MPIAVVGIGCRYAGVRGPEALWDALCEGRDLVSDTPPARYEAAVYARRDSLTGDPLLATEAGGFLDDIESFDAGFFRISPREAARLDPHQRLFLETAVDAVEDAGIPLARLRGSRTGVYSSQLNVHYWEQLRRAGINDLHSLVGAQIPGNMPGRLAHVLDLRGPTVSIDAACSSTLLAVHMACQALRLGETEAAIVGGVNILAEPADTVALSSGALISQSGRCRFGDEAADGFVRSEASAAVVLKPLERALADGDRVYGVIRGSVATNDGASGGQFLTPSTAGRGEMLLGACLAAGVDLRDVDYVEAHGAGTPVGDLSELTAIAEVFGRPRGADGRVLVGSVKSNLGHTETVSGLSGLIKTVLALSHEEIPATLHVQRPTPEFAWRRSGLRLVRRHMPWPRTDHVPTAGVSSFGISGSNVHVVLTAPPDAAAVEAPSGPAPAARILPVSAHCPDTLGDLAGAYARRLGAVEEPAAVADLCHSAAVRRTHHAFRSVAVGGDAASLAERLTRSRTLARTPRAFEDPRIVFVFPGLGGQWTGMARDLLAQCPEFAAAMARYDAAIRAEADWSVLDLLHSDDPLTDIGLAQPAVWAFECALAEVWEGWGLVPDLLIGHSMGEIAAATFSGALSLADGAAVICRRSALMRSTAGIGGMTAVQLPGTQAQRLAARHSADVCVAVHSSPGSAVLAGPVADLERIERELTERGVFWRRVNADVAAHCASMDPLLDDLRVQLDGLTAAEGRIPVQSTVDGERTHGGFGIEYWVDNLREPVLFEPAVRRVLEEDRRPTLFVEFTPQRVLAHSLQDCIDEYGTPAAVVSTLRRAEPGLSGLLEALGQAYVHGADPDWEAVVGGTGRFASPPLYPWRRRRFRVADAEPNIPADLLPVVGGGAATAPAPAAAVAVATIVQETAAAAAAGAPPDGVRGEVDVRAGLRATLAEVLALDPAELEHGIPMTRYGLDSVMAMDLGRRVLRRYGVVVPVKILLQGGTLDEVAAQAAPTSSAAA
ncbi:MAG TPA: acyltransferase domain-containing protein [Actinospica sp.]|nr:acyltransferase domain-containing protein [Actinospica sp.]